MAGSLSLKRKTSGGSFLLMDKNMWNEKQDNRMKYFVVGVMILFFVGLFASQAKATTINEYNFAPEVVELHIIKNDGMNSHEVYTCRNVRTCYNLYRSIQYKDKSLNCASKMFIVRQNGNKMWLKSTR